MKTEVLIAAVLGAGLGLFGQAHAGENELSRHQVPKAVLDAFGHAYPQAKDVEFEQEQFEGKTAYEVEFKDNGKEYEVSYTADGTLVQKEEEIDIQALPEPVVQAITKAYPKGKLEEAEVLMKPDGTITGYEVEIKEGSKELELELDAGGKILNTERD